MAYQIITRILTCVNNVSEYRKIVGKKNFPCVPFSNIFWLAALSSSYEAVPERLYSKKGKHLTSGGTIRKTAVWKSMGLLMKGLKPMLSVLL